MRIAYDTEFLENGSTIELISIGMVAEDGRELYCVAQEIESDPLHDRIRTDQWLMKNVVPHLPLRSKDGIREAHDGLKPMFFLDQNDNRVMPRRMIRNAVREFVQATPNIELWADYAAYDHVALAQLFGRMISLPDGFPMFTHDLQQEIRRLGVTGLPEQEGTEHNALDDARHVMASLIWLGRTKPGTSKPSAGEATDAAR